MRIHAESTWTPPPHDPDQPPAQIRRILRLFRPYRGRLGFVGLLVGASSLVGVASPFLLREILDTAIPQGRTGLLTLLALGMILTAVVTSVFGVLQTLISTTVGQRVMHDLRTAVYAQLQRMPLAFFTRTRTGEVQSRIANDIGGMQATVTSTATSLVSNVTAVLATIVAMLALDWRLTVVSLLLLPVFVWISRRVGRERKAITTQRQKQMAAMAATVTESLSVSGILLGRTMGRADSLTRSFADESERLVDLEVRASMAGRWRMATITIVMAAMPALLYWAAGLALRAGGPTISIGTLVAFVTLQQGLLRPAVSLLSTGVQIQTSLALFQRIFEYLDLPVDITETERPVRLERIRGEIRFEDVAFHYDRGDEKSGPTLDGIDITVPAGSSLAVVGATGSGKSTLSYLVPRLYDVTDGRVTLDGVDVRELDFDTLARGVGVVSQETYLFHASVADNLRFARPDATDAEIEAAARAAQIHDHIASLPDGYDTLVGERGYRFSGGEKQRLAIARTILRDPPVLILDEATSALDTRTEQAVQQAIDALSAGRTTITIAHRLSTVRAADQIVVLDAGRIVERGSHAELLAKGGRYAALVHGDARMDTNGAHTAAPPPPWDGGAAAPDGASVRPASPRSGGHRRAGW
ncbi:MULTISPECIES: ABC transporter ATP-binding protein [Streptomyces]|uniref:Multidrug ABC transporter ATP-binding protein n=2 Tax=Streptomyces TaxID=1883 RepID=A0A100Y0V1_9ACTN|nr:MULTISPECIES: ABC transporter ATP-binding protein [Streptomyces]KUH35629.1 multidrug ABC transporter ATP-binding protein [Streptomyces kanasensis]UUS29926.1 ABC transporter ATP-binding protein/permease [Streptomyces changanensis]